MFNGLILIVGMQFVFSQNALAYLDPGTGSFLFQILLATLIGGLYTIRTFWKNICGYISNIFTKNKSS